jgi:Amt family ammonium transporter
MDMGSKNRKPTFLGGINGMIVGLVGITPAAGYVNGWGALAIGIIGSFVVWFSFNKLATKWIFAKVDDALGVIHTHGLAGLMGGVMTGLFADPKMIEYLGIGKASSVSVKGLLYGHPWQVVLQLFAGAWVIGWSALGTFVLLKVVALITPLRFDDETLEIGDLAIHDEQVEPSEFARRIFPGSAEMPSGAGYGDQVVEGGGVQSISLE